jgi:hypothetical protein
MSESLAASWWDPVAVVWLPVVTVTLHKAASDCAAAGAGVVAPEVLPTAAAAVEGDIRPDMVR